MNRLALVWGIEPVQVELTTNAFTEDEIMAALTAVRERSGLKPGSRVVVTAGLRTNKSGATNILEVREIPRNS